MMQRRTIIKKFNAHLHLSFACADETAIMTKIVAINQFVFILTGFC